LQDLGRTGQGRFGVSPSGAMDPLALTIANRLVGNPDGAAALEITAAGPEIVFETPTCFALAGGNLTPALAGEPIEIWRSHHAADGEVLTFGARRQGARCYLAVAGGLAVSPVLGSAATDLEAHLGGLDGGPLRAGQRIPIGAAEPQPEQRVRLPLLRVWADPFELRFIASPALPTETAERFSSAEWKLSPRSNRMGYRLDGPALAGGSSGAMLSEPISPGTIQLPADGQPILLMADRPTIGGYPRLGALIAADLPKAGQLWLGHTVRFVPCSLAAAEQAHAALRTTLANAIVRC
jgi:biotin-dependent carboxylase-like uncharacterized protein